MSGKMFCTCTDLNCPFHPTKHDGSCTPCIAKNLKEKEIPNCLFLDATGTTDHEAFHYEDFAKAVLAKKCGE